LVPVFGRAVWRWLDCHNLNHRNYLALFGVPSLAMLINHLVGSVSTAFIDDLLAHFIVGVIFGWLSLVGYELIRDNYKKRKIRAAKSD
jgi:hypothetical protein